MQCILCKVALCLANLTLHCQLVKISQFLIHLLTVQYTYNLCWVMSISKLAQYWRISRLDEKLPPLCSCQRPRQLAIQCMQWLLRKCVEGFVSEILEPSPCNTFNTGPCMSVWILCTCELQPWLESSDTPLNRFSDSGPQTPFSGSVGA